MRTEAPAGPDFSRELYCLLGLPIDAVDLAGAEARIRGAAARRSPCFLSTPNVNFLVAARSDEAFRRSVIHSDLSVADGMPLVWLARLMDIPIRSRVAGANLFEALRARPSERLSVFFFGGQEGAGEAAWHRLAGEAEGLDCVGFEFPGFGSVQEMSTGDLLRRINASRADLLVVSLGARKGQAWIEANRHKLEVPVVSHLGAVLNFAAGRTRRAPAWMQRAGLEWVWRIKEEPALWRRYLRDGIALLGLAATRALPYAWYVRRHRPDAATLARAGVEIHEGRQRLTLRLQGAWTRANLDPLREHFSRACAAGKALRLDLAGVSFVDSAFVALLMLLERHQRKLGQPFVLAAPPEPVRRVLYYCCAEYLYAGTTKSQEAL